MKPEQAQSFSRRLWTAAGLVIALCLCIVAYIQAERRIEIGNERRLEAVRLADELGDSSDNTTRMARTYVATGDPSFRDAYMEVLAVRDGAKPRRGAAAAVYWELGLPGAAGAVPLVELMRKAGVTDEELETFERADAGADALGLVEQKAMDEAGRLAQN